MAPKRRQHAAKNQKCGENKHKVTLDVDNTVIINCRTGTCFRKRTISALIRTTELTNHASLSYWTSWVAYPPVLSLAPP